MYKHFSLTSERDTKGCEIAPGCNFAQSCVEICIRLHCAYKRGFSNTGPDPLENHKATKLAFHVGPSSARKAKLAPLKWRFAGRPVMAR